MRHKALDIGTRLGREIVAREDRAIHDTSIHERVKVRPKRAPFEAAPERLDNHPFSMSRVFPESISRMPG